MADRTALERCTFIAPDNRQCEREAGHPGRHQTGEVIARWNCESYCRCGTREGHFERNDETGVWVRFTDIGPLLTNQDGRRSDEPSSQSGLGTAAREPSSAQSSREAFTSKTVTHEQRVVQHASGWREPMNTCVCGQAWPCPAMLRSEQVAFAFIRELQKRFNATTPLSDIEIAQEQGWRHDVEQVCAAYQAAHSSVETECEPADPRRDCPWKCNIGHPYCLCQAPALRPSVKSDCNQAAGLITRTNTPEAAADAPNIRGANPEPSAPAVVRPTLSEPPSLGSAAGVDLTVSKPAQHIPGALRCEKHGVTFAFDGDTCWACQEESNAPINS